MGDDRFDTIIHSYYLVACKLFANFATRNIGRSTVRGRAITGTKSISSSMTSMA